MRLDEQRHPYLWRQLHFTAQIAGDIGQRLEFSHPRFGRFVDQCVSATGSG